MKRVVGYRIVGTDRVIPIRDWESFDGLYYQLQGYEFVPVWSE